MKTGYEYIYFEIIEEKPKTKVWGCYNNNSTTRIGEVKWYAGWRQYCFFPYEDSVFSKGCLDDIGEFIQQLMDERKKNSNNKCKKCSVEITSEPPIADMVNKP